ncbi:MAG: hypothetical protein K8R88_08120 [Armatimonadetes bacterium]|nr:hypothetical protein [Armatimonadota bacterium]
MCSNITEIDMTSVTISGQNANIFDDRAIFFPSLGILVLSVSASASNLFPQMEEDWIDSQIGKCGPSTLVLLSDGVPYRPKGALESYNVGPAALSQIALEGMTIGWLDEPDRLDFIATHELPFPVVEPGRVLLPRA